MTGNINEKETLTMQDVMLSWQSVKSTFEASEDFMGTWIFDTTIHDYVVLISHNNVEVFNILQNTPIVRSPEFYKAIDLTLKFEESKHERHVFLFDTYINIE